MTIHKSQGLTLPNVVVDLDDSESVLGLAYVALSRVKKLTDLAILNAIICSRFQRSTALLSNREIVENDLRKLNSRDYLPVYSKINASVFEERDKDIQVKKDNKKIDKKMPKNKTNFVKNFTNVKKVDINEQPKKLNTRSSINKNEIKIGSLN